MSESCAAVQRSWPPHRAATAAFQDTDLSAFDLGAGSGRARDPLLLSSQRAGRTRKRKSRAKKSCETTFIETDPANFRQMVQQVTGARPRPVVKPEPQRGCVMPTLDTSSAFLLDLEAAVGPVCGSLGSFEPGPGFDLESWSL